MSQPELTAERLRELLSYNPEMGVFTRLVSTSSNALAGGAAGSISKNGYCMVCVDGSRFRVHRLAWLWMTGEWPVAEIDHINMDRADNRWCNLREATQSQNEANTLKRTNNTSGFKGVCFDYRQMESGHQDIGGSGSPFVPAALAALSLLRMQLRRLRGRRRLASMAFPYRCQRRRKTKRAVVARTIIHGTVGAMKEYTDSIAFANGSARSRQFSDNLFKIAHGTTLASSLAVSRCRR